MIGNFFPLPEPDEVNVYIGKATGQFEISSDDGVIASGTIQLGNDLKIIPPVETVENFVSSKTGVYEKLDRENYIVGKHFQNLDSLEITENGMY